MGGGGVRCHGRVNFTVLQDSQKWKCLSKARAELGFKCRSVQQTPACLGAEVHLHLLLPSQVAPHQGLSTVVSGASSRPGLRFPRMWWQEQSKLVLLHKPAVNWPLSDPGAKHRVGSAALESRWRGMPGGEAGSCTVVTAPASPCCLITGPFT